MTRAIVPLAGFLALAVPETAINGVRCLETRV